MRSLSFGRRRQQGASLPTSTNITEDASSLAAGAPPRRPALAPTASARPSKEDAAIAATASDAILSKLNSASAGYYNDPFIVHFAHGAEGLTASSSTSASGAAAATNATLGMGGGYHSHRHHHYHHRPKRPARAHSSPVDSSSSATSSLYNDDEDEHRHKHHNAQPHQFHQMQHAQSHNLSDHQYHTTNVSSNSNPLANMSPSDIHPALRGRLGLGIGSGGGGGDIAGVHPGLRPHLSAGGQVGGIGMAPAGGRAAATQMRGQPLIRRGTHARVCVIDRALTAFLSMNLGMQQQQEEERQVVILGAGRDTSYLRYLAGELIGGASAQSESNTMKQQQQHRSVRWYEIDQLGVIKTKLELLRTCPSVNVEVARGGTNEASPSYALQVRLKNGDDTATASARGDDVMDTEPALLPYHLIGHDLRLPPSHLFSSLQSSHHGFDPSVPTLFVMECVQMYMPESSAMSLLREISSMCGANALLALYDPILGSDGFGRVMEQHLTRAGVVAPPAKDSNDQLCLTASRTLDSQLDRLFGCGWNTVVGCDMLAAYDTVVDAEQRRKANTVEMLDEVEEWVLIMRHYCFIVAGVSTSATSDANIARHFCSVGKPPFGFVEARCSVRSST